MFRSLLFSALALNLCAQGAAPKAGAKPEVKPAPAPAPEDKVIARLGDEVIRQSEVDNYAKAMNPQQRMAMGPQVAKAYLELRTLVAKAKKDGLANSPEFAAKIKMAEYQMLATTLLERDSKELNKRLEPKEEDLKAFYEANKAQFKTPERFDARHILVKVKGGPNGESGYTEEEAKARLETIRQELEGKPAVKAAKGKKGSKAVPAKGWDEVAKTYSDDPGSKDRGGLYENISFGQFVPEFDKAVRDQEAGKMGAPVKTAYGYHLIQVEKLTPASEQPFEAVKDQVRQRVQAERKEKVWTEYLADLRKEVGYVETAPAPAPAPAPVPAPIAAPKPAPIPGSQK